MLVLRGFPKTVYFNLRVLPFRQAIRLPLLASPKVAFYDLRGKVTIRGRLRPAMILIGFGEVGAFDFRRSRAVWQVSGRVIFEGPARLGSGFKLSVADSGIVTFGSGFVGITESQVLCRNKVSFGEDLTISWNVLITDTDFHLLIPGDRPPRPSDAAYLHRPRILDWGTLDDYEGRPTASRHGRCGRLGCRELL